MDIPEEWDWEIQPREVGESSTWTHIPHRDPPRQDKAWKPLAVMKQQPWILDKCPPFVKNEEGKKKEEIKQAQLELQTWGTDPGKLEEEQRTLAG